MADLAQSAYLGFKAGEGQGQPNALGMFIKNFVGEFQKRKDMEMATQLKTQSEIDVMNAKGNIENERQGNLLKSLMGGGGVGGGEGGTGNAPWMVKQANIGDFTIENTDYERYKQQSKVEDAKAKDLNDANDFISGLAQQYKNTEMSMPKAEPTQFQQRIKGMGIKMGVATGIGVTPRQTGEVSTQKIRARSLIKKFESGRLTDADVNDAVNGMTDVTRTPEERLATVVNLATAIAADKGLDPDEAKRKLADNLGMSIGQIDSMLNGKGTVKSGADYKSRYGLE